MKNLYPPIKIATTLLCALFLANPISVQAIEVLDTPCAAVCFNSNTTITPRADVIVKKYRTYNNQLQYRRWNKTQGCWVDNAWINVN